MICQIECPKCKATDTAEIEDKICHKCIVCGTMFEVSADGTHSSYILEEIAGHANFGCSPSRNGCDCPCHLDRRIMHCAPCC